jgi:hypothetical protein
MRKASVERNLTLRNSDRRIANSDLSASANRRAAGGLATDRSERRPGERENEGSDDGFAGGRKRLRGGLVDQREIEMEDAAGAVFRIGRCA